jgi:hypothetical protein
VSERSKTVWKSRFKKFLGYAVSDLERLWDPWQRHKGWDDLELFIVVD